MDSDRVWTSTREKLPLDNSVVLVAYCEEAANRLFLGCYFSSGWTINDSENNLCPWWKDPDFWMLIPVLPKVNEREDYE